MQPSASGSGDEPFLIRTALEKDRQSVPASWWHPDAGLAGARSLVVESADTIVAAAARRPNRVHPRRDSAWLHVSGPADGSATSGQAMSGQAVSREAVSGEKPVPAGVAVLQALRAAGELPLSLKAKPGTIEHATIVAAGGTVYQHCPAELVPTGTPELGHWCEARFAEAARVGVHLVRGDEQTTGDLTRIWTQLYEVVHAGWSPTGPTADLWGVFGPMIEDELDPVGTVLGLVDGEIVAACCVFLGSDPAVEAVAEGLVPGHPRARAAVGACLAEVLTRTDGRPVEFDGHRSDPHFFPLVESLPDVRSGETPLDLLEL